MLDANSEPVAPPNRRGVFGIGILLIIIVSVIGFVLYQTISSGTAALLIESNPQSIVYINDKQEGKTPFEIEMPAEEVVIKLIPESFTVPLTPYETKVTLVEGVKTIVRRSFGEGEGDAETQIISFEKAPSGETNIAVVSDPDGVEVSLDGQTEGVTPLKVSVAPGLHTLSLSSENYTASTFEVRAVSGYTVTAIVDLSPMRGENVVVEEAFQEEEVLSGVDSPAQTIVILDTSVGFLRVRAEAGTESEEVGRVIPDDEFEVLGHDEAEDWYEIEYEEGDTGWVSGEFVSEAQIDEE